MPSILQTEALTRRFGALTATNAVSIAVEAGEAFGLLGRNGAGKTTLIKMLTTLLPPTSGTATIGGYDIRRQAAKVRRLIGYVPQALSADGELTGYENLRIFAALYDIPSAGREARIQEALAFMELTEAAGKLVRTYSGGMIRRLEIAQSMLHRPRLLFLDEPTVGLDPVAREAVWERVRELRVRHGVTLFLTTHYMDEAQALCDRFALMRAGTIVAVGTLEALRARLGAPEATLDEIFAAFTEGAGDDAAAYAATRHERELTHRLG